jgi:hypothetical protein
MAERADSRAFRKARRLVLEELETTVIHLELLLHNGTTPMGIGAAADLFPMTQWEEHRATPAELLPDDVWEPMPRVFQSLRTHRLLLA